MKRVHATLVHSPFVSVVLAITGVAAWGQPGAHAVTFTTDTTISCSDTTYDGQDIVVDGATLTVDCAHAFNGLSVINGGVVTHTPGQVQGLQLTVTQDVTIDAASRIDASGKGQLGGQGPGAGPSAPNGCCTGGGGYGGAGGKGRDFAGGSSYGSFTEPADLGSGGGNPEVFGSGGSGGGRVRLDVGGTLRVDGKLTANGAKGAVTGGGGSGGSVYLVVGTLAGAGAITANGGDGNLKDAGGGGGGRMALRYGTVSFTGTYSACGGSGAGTGTSGGAGTILVRSASGSFEGLLIDNQGKVGATTDLVGAEILVGSMSVKGGAIVSHPAGQHIHLIVQGDLRIESGAAISANGRGHVGGTGPGAGANSPDGCCSGGGGYGGAGGKGRDTAGGGTYGSETAPIDLGSGGGDPVFYGKGGSGGGAWHLTVGGTLQVDGKLSADGAKGSFTSGGGSGGSILLQVGRLAGAGLVTANGADGDNTKGGGGGGGRIAIYSSDLSGFDPQNIKVNGGAGFKPGAAGTIRTAATASLAIADIPDAKIPVDKPYTGPTPTLVQGQPPVTWSLVTGPSGMTIDTQTGVVTWASPTLEGSPHTVTIRASNGIESDDETWTLTVVLPPLIADIADASVQEGSAYTGTTPSLIQGTPPVKWVLAAGPAGMTINEDTGVVTWPRATAEGSPHAITVRATNDGGSHERTWHLTVTAAPPQIGEIFDAIIAEAVLYTGPTPTLVQGTPPITWSLKNGPAGMTINDQNGVVTWPSPTTEDSPYTVTITATNAQGSADRSWKLTVVKQPVIGDIPDKTVFVCEPYTGPQPVLTQGSIVVWSLVTNPPGMSINATNGVVSWPCPTLESSPHTITIRATNVAGTADETWKLTVAARCPVIRDIADAYYRPGAAYTGPTPSLSEGTAPITWSLAAGPSGMTIDAQSGVVFWPNPDAACTPCTITICARNACGETCKNWMLIAMVKPDIQPIPDATITAGQPYTGPTPTLATPTPVKWSLLAGPSGMTINGTNGVVTWPNPKTDGSPHYVLIQAQNDVGLDTEDWNLTVVPPIVPDLVVDKITQPDFAYDGKPAEFTWTVKNSGTGAANGSWKEAVYLRADGEAGNGLLMGEFIHQGGLDASASYTRTESLDIPAGYHGNYYFVVVTDSQNTVNEPNGEGNNTRVACCVTTIIQEQLPDLQVSQITTEASGFIDNDFSVAWKVTNAGPGTAAGNWIDRVYLSTDDRFDPAADSKVAEVPVNGPLSPSSFYVRTATFKLPHQAGPYWIFIATDDGKTVPEADDTNNVGVQALSVQAPDYTATVKANVETALAGTPVTLTVQATRIGTGTPATEVDVTIRIKLKGTRRVIKGKTNQLGQFGYIFLPLRDEAGKYEVSAEHPAVPDPAVPQCRFTLLGLQFEPAEMALSITPGHTVEFSGTTASRIVLRNLADDMISGIQFGSATGAPPPLLVTVDPVPSLVASQADYLHVILTARDDLTAPGPGQPIAVQIPVTIPVGGVTKTAATLAFQIYVTPKAAVLTVSPTRLESNMLVGSQTIVGFQVSNVGEAPARDVAVTLPDTPNPPCDGSATCPCREGPWLNTVASPSLGDIGPGETRQIDLSLLPSCLLPRTIYSGQIVVAESATSNGVRVPFAFRAMTDQKGALLVLAEDEGTYYGTGCPSGCTSPDCYHDSGHPGPLVPSASVNLIDAVSKSPYASGTTDTCGALLLQNIPEGFYTLEVNAERHGTARFTVQVVAGRQTEARAFLPSQSVTYEWTVVPTEIEDKYTITIEAVFETYVPAPRVTIKPELVDLGGLEGETMTVNYEIRNDGFIAAKGAAFAFANHPKYEFIPLVEELGDIPAMRPDDPSIVVPVTIRKKAAASPDMQAASAGGAGPALASSNDCGRIDACLSWYIICQGPQYYCSSMFYRYPEECGGGITGGGWAVGGGGGGGGAYSGGATIETIPASCDPPLNGGDDGPGDCGAGGSSGLVCCGSDAGGEAGGDGSGGSGSGSGSGGGWGPFWGWFWGWFSSWATGNQTDPVYLFSGELFQRYGDLRIRGRGVDFFWQRTYRSKARVNTAQGNGWDYNYNIRLEQHGLNLVLHDGAGRADTFTPQSDGTWGRDEFFLDIRKNPDGTYLLTFANKGVLRFNPFDGSPAAGRMASLADRNGNTMTFQYDAAGRLTKVTDTLGRDIVIGYNDHDLITSITDFAGRQVKYDYYADGDAGGSAGDLKSVTSPAVTGTPNNNDFPNGKTIGYTYSKGFAEDRLNHNLLTITDPRRNDPNDPTYGAGPFVQNIYATTTDASDRNFDRVVRQIWGGQSIDITYTPETPTAANGQSVMRTIVRDRVGNVRSYSFDLANRLVRKRYYTGRADPTQPTTVGSNRPTNKLRPGDPDFFETRYEWNADSQLTRVTHPDGAVTEYVYKLAVTPDAVRRTRGNLLEVRHLPGTHTPVGDQTQIVEKYEYDDNVGCSACGFNFATKETDGNGNSTNHTYDDKGNRIRTVHADPSIVEDFEYNQFGQMTAHVLPDNGSSYRRRDEYVYYDSGPQKGFLKQQVVDAATLRLTTAYEYDALGNVVKMTDPRGHDTQYTVNALDQIVREASREVEVIGGSKVRYLKDTAYDANNNVVRVDVQNVDDNGVVQPNAWLTTSYEYEILNKLTRMTQEVTESHVIVTEYAYDANRNQTLVRYGEATAGRQPTNTVTTLYDERNLVFREIRAEGDPAQSTTQYDYDGDGNRIAVRSGIESSERVTTNAYDIFNRLAAVTDPMGNVTTYTYDANGNKVRARVDGELEDVPGSAANVRLSDTNYTYDAMNRLTQTDVAFFDALTQTPITTDGNGDGWATTKTFYTPNSQVWKVVDDRGNATLTTYDGANRRKRVTDAKNNTVTYGYDPNGNVASVTEVDKSDLGNPDQVSTTTYQYDSLNRQVAVIDNIGSTNRSHYDSRGDRIRTLDALDHEVLYQYDGLNRLVRTIRDMDGNGLGSANPAAVSGDPDVGTESIVTQQGWDDCSRLITQTDDNGNTTTYLYDSLGRKISEVYADTTRKDWRFDAHGDNVFWQDANQNIVANTYDTLGRLTRRDVKVGPGVSNDTTFEVYKCDGASRLTWAENDHTTVTRRYDSLGHITRETQDLYGDPTITWPTAVVSSVYDGVGNLIRLAYPGGLVVATTYNALNCKKTITDSSGMIATYWYVGPNRVERREYGNGTRSEWTYDGTTGAPNPANDFGIKHIVRTNHYRISDGATIDDRAYTWDRMDNKTEQTDMRSDGPHVRHTYTYDNIYRLVRSDDSDASGLIDTIQYVLDGVGNRQEVIGGPDAGIYTMDSAQPGLGSRQMNLYTRTPFDERTYDRNGNAAVVAGATTRRWRYDFFNRPTSTDTQGERYRFTYDCFSRRVSEGANVAARNIYDNWRVIQDGSQASEVCSFVYGAFIDDTLMVSSAGRKFFMHYGEPLNSVAVTDSDGALSQRCAFSDYGIPLEGARQFLRFGGASWNEASATFDRRTRQLEPRSGRFLSRDWIGIWGDMTNLGNASSYVNSNPMTFLDPYGLDTYKCRVPLSGLCKATGVCKVIEKPLPLYHEYLLVVTKDSSLPNGHCPKHEHWWSSVIGLPASCGDSPLLTPPGGFCTLVAGNNDKLDACVLSASQPNCYLLVPTGPLRPGGCTNCQGFVKDTLAKCRGPGVTVYPPGYPMCQWFPWLPPCQQVWW